MKNLHSFMGIFLFYCLLNSNTYAQIPQSIPYQAVARDNAGSALTNQVIFLRFTIRHASAAGTIVYCETQSVSTNTLGLLTANIGDGTVITGTFVTIDWGGGTKFLQVEMDTSGGTTYVDMGTQQMLSVPYALHAGSSSDWIKSGNNIYNSNSGNVGIWTAAPLNKLSVNGNVSIGDSGTGNLAPPNGLLIRGRILQGDTGYVPSNRLIWVESIDDGNGENDVIGYSFVRSTPAEQITAFKAVVSGTDTVRGVDIKISTEGDSAFVTGVNLHHPNTFRDDPYAEDAVRILLKNLSGIDLTGTDYDIAAPKLLFLNKGKLTGLSDSSVMKGTLLTPDGIGKQFTGFEVSNLDSGDTGTHEVGHWMGLSAAGFDVRLKALTEVIGAHIVVDNASPSTRVQGVKIKPGPNATLHDTSAKKWCFRVAVTDDGWKNTTVTDMLFAAPVSITGNRLRLYGLTDTSKVTGMEVTAGGVGETFTGIKLTMIPEVDDEVLILPTFRKADGCEINIAATDSATGSKIIVDQKSDTTKMRGIAIRLGPNAGFADSTKKDWCVDVMVTDGEGMNSRGISMVAGGKENVTGLSAVLSGQSDTTSLYGSALGITGTGNRAVGYYFGPRFLQANGFVTVTGPDLPPIERLPFTSFYRTTYGSEYNLRASDTIVGSKYVFKYPNDSIKKLLGSSYEFDPLDSVRGGYPVVIESKIRNAATAWVLDVNVEAWDTAGGNKYVLSGKDSLSHILGEHYKIKGPAKTGTGMLLESSDLFYTEGTRITISADSAAVGHSIGIAGENDSTELTGTVVVPEGTGGRLTGHYLANYTDSGDTQTHEVGHWMGKVAVGNDIRLTAEEFVKGAHVQLKAQSATTTVIGNETTLEGGGAINIAHVKHLRVTDQRDGYGDACDNLGSVMRDFTGSKVTFSPVSRNATGISVVADADTWSGGSRLIALDARVTTIGMDTAGGIRFDLRNTNVNIGCDIRVEDGIHNTGVRVIAKGPGEGGMFDVSDGAKAIVALGGNSGFGTSEPLVRLDVKGSFAVRDSGIVIAAAQNNNMNWTESNGGVVMTGWGASFALSGLTAGTNGKMLYLTNGTIHPCTLQYENSGSADNNRIITGTGNDIVLEPGKTAVLRYSVHYSRWMVISVGVVNAATQTSLQLESASRISADSLLLEMINQETQNRIDAILSEASLRVYADSLLQAALLAEAIQRSLDDSLLFLDLNNDTEWLDFRIIADSLTLVFMDSVLHERIDAEILDRAEADSILFTLTASEPSTICWSLSGNDSLNADSNFVGTTDAVPLVFRTNNLERARITPLGLVGIGTVLPTSMLDVNGDINSTSGYKVAGTASTGQYLRGNGSQFVASTLQAIDLTGIVPVSNIPLLAGDVSGTLATVSVDKIKGISVSPVAPAEGMILKLIGGVLAWETDETATKVSFEAGVQIHPPVPSAVPTTVAYGTLTMNDGGGYNPVTGIFTAPSTGRYHFDASVFWQGVGVGGTYTTTLTVNGIVKKQAYNTFNFAQDYLQSLSIDLPLNAGDLVSVVIQQTSGVPKNLVGGNTACTFSGHQLY